MDFTVNMSARYRAGLVWFRRDLRTTDHAALYHALRQCARALARTEPAPLPNLAVELE